MSLEDLADFFYDLIKDYALVFDVVHYIVCIMAERADLGTDFDKVKQRNPLVM